MGKQPLKSYIRKRLLGKKQKGKFSNPEVDSTVGEVNSDSKLFQNCFSRPLTEEETGDQSLFWLGLFRGEDDECEILESFTSLLQLEKKSKLGACPYR